MRDEEPSVLSFKLPSAPNCTLGYCSCDGNGANCNETITFSSDNVIFCNGQKTLDVVIDEENWNKPVDIPVTGAPNPRTELNGKEVLQSILIEARNVTGVYVVDRVLGLSRKCSIYGDPHVRTLDGKGYVNAAQGYNSLIDSTHFKVQVYTSRWYVSLRFYQPTAILAQEDLLIELTCALTRQSSSTRTNLLLFPLTRIKTGISPSQVRAKSSRKKRE